jgi:hypothetical protein
METKGYSVTVRAQISFSTEEKRCLDEALDQIDNFEISCREGVYSMWLDADLAHRLSIALNSLNRSDPGWRRLVNHIDRLKDDLIQRQVKVMIE